MGPLIRPALASDGEAFARVYNPYIAGTVVTFEEEPVTGAEMTRRLEAVLARGLPWLVAEEEGAVVGYAYGGVWRERSAYRLSTEAAIYLDESRTRKGLGSKLYAALLPQLKERGLHSVIGGIALPNAASVALHERFGFRKVAHFAEVGYKLGKWVDVGYWQLLL